MFLFLNAYIEYQMWKTWIQKLTKIVLDVEPFDWLDVESINLEVTWENLREFAGNEEVGGSAMYLIKTIWWYIPILIFEKMRVWLTYDWIEC